MNIGNLLRPLLVVGLVVCALSAHAQRNLKEIPDTDPKSELESFLIAEGFEVNLFAADPQIAKPIQMNFDADGRLWVAGSKTYPQIKPGETADDEIVVLEDTTGDGVADKRTVFADGLLIPTGVLPGDGGAYVVNSTEVLHLVDTTGDGKADKRRVVLSGFGTEDTHHLLHTLRWGMDGNLYMNQSIYIHSHVETPRGVKRLNAGGVWRFRPETMELDVLCEGFINPWGHAFNRWGQSFLTDGAFGEGINYAFPGAVFVATPGAPRRLRGLNPGSPKHCGLEILGGEHLPEDWRGNMITNDFRGHRVCRFVISEDEAGFASQQMTELIKTRHGAFRPIDVKMGPDGAIYIADWYNPIIQHGEVDFRDDRRDHTHGRIWRVTAKNRPLVERQKLSEASIDELIAALQSPQPWIRLQAKLQLKHRDAETVRIKLNEWAESLSRDDPNYDQHRIEALWAFQTINSEAPALLYELLQSKNHNVRAAAVRVASQWSSRLKNPQTHFAAAAADTHPRVQLEGVRALAINPNDDTARQMLAAHADSLDQFLDFALWKGVRETSHIWLPKVKESGAAVLSSKPGPILFALESVGSPEVVPVLISMLQRDDMTAEQTNAALRMIAELGGPAELSSVIDTALDADQPVALRAGLLNEVVTQSARRKVVPQGDLNRLIPLIASTDANLQAAAIRAAGVWKIADAQRVVLDTVRSKKAALSVRKAAVAAVGAYGLSDVLSAIAAEGTAPVEIREEAVIALSAKQPAAAAKAGLQLLVREKGVNIERLFKPLLSQKQGPAKIEAALNGVELTREAGQRLLRLAQASPNKSKTLNEAITRAGSLSDASWTKLSADGVKELAALALKEGNAARGEAIYRRGNLSCTKCHAIGGAGGVVGPDLLSLGASAPIDYIVDSLVHPNAKQKENYHSLIIMTDEGKILSGIVVSQTDNEIVMRNADDEEIRVPTESIEAMKEGRSLMPEGAVDSLTKTELADLSRFLSELGKVGDFAVGDKPVVRRWRTLIYTPEAWRRLNRTSYDSAANESDEAFTWQPIYSKVNGDVPVEPLTEFRPFRQLDPTAFLRCRIRVAKPGVVGLRFASIEHLSLYVDGKPTELTGQTTPIELTEGEHSIMITINKRQRTAPVRLEIAAVEGSTAVAAPVAGK